MIKSEIKQQILDRSLNSTSFQTLYPGYRYFTAEIEGEVGVIAYVNTWCAWVGASDPVISKEKLLPFLRLFRTAAARLQKRVLILPVSQELAELARSGGYFALQIGNEPWFKLNKERNHASAKLIAKKGAVVESFDPSKLAVEEKLELDEITSQWLYSRKMAPLSFLNRVEPWHLFQKRRYFRLKFRKQYLGFLAAVPVKARSAWYLVDLIRRPDSPPGTTELLVIECAKKLQLEGAKAITLGMSPFSDPSPEEYKVHPFYYRCFRTIFHKMEHFYGFKTLFQYKQKFNADSWEPQFLICLDKRVGIRAILGLTQATFPKGLTHTLFSTLHRSLRRFDWAWFYRNTLNKQVVPKSPPPDLLSFLSRCRITSLLILVTGFHFLSTTDENFQIRKRIVDRYAYSFENWTHGASPTRGFIDLTISSFLHWDVTHLITNLGLFLFTTTVLECLFGSTLTLISFSCGILFTNPLTSLLLAPTLYLFSSSKLNAFLLEPDIGVSLGIFATIGTLGAFVKRPILWISLFALVTVIYNLEVKSFLGYNHLVAIAIGLLIGKIYASKY